MATSGLESIPEDTPQSVSPEATVDANARWECETDPVKLKLWRSHAKTAHTKSRQKIAVSHRSSLDILESLRVQLCRDYEDARRRHERYVAFSNGADAINDDVWLRQLAEDHRLSLASVDRTIVSRQQMRSQITLPEIQIEAEVETVQPIEARPVKETVTHGHGSTLSLPARSEVSAYTSVSQQSRSSSIKSQLQIAQIQEEQLQMELQQAELEAQVQLEEELHLQSLAIEAKRIAFERKQREIGLKLAQQRAVKEKLRVQVETENQTSVEPVRTSMITPPQSAIADIPSAGRLLQGAFQRLRNVTSSAIEKLTPRRVGQPLQPIELASKPTLKGAMADNMQTHTSLPPQAPQPLAQLIVRSPRVEPTQSLTAPPANDRSISDRRVIRLAETTYPTASAARTTMASNYGFRETILKDTACEEQYDDVNHLVALATPVGASICNDPMSIPSTHSPDNWIFESEAGASRSVLLPPKLKLMQFDGNPLNWPLFIQSFKVQVHDAVRSDAERIAHLANCLPLRIRSELGHAIINPGLYRFALAELKRRYGNRQLIVKSCAMIIEQLKPFGDTDAKGLSNLSASLRSVVGTLQLCSFTAELNSYATVASVLDKVSPKLQEKWSELTWSKQPHVPTLLELSDFLDNASMAAYARRVGTSTRRSTGPAQTSGTLPATTQRSRPAVFTVTTTVSCYQCKGSHPLTECDQFRRLSLAHRADLVKRDQLCLRCLEQGHRSRECARDETSSIEGCQHLHHRLLHGAPRLYSRKATPPAAAFNGSTSRRRGSPTLLPIVPVTLRANECSVNTFAFLDSGSELTLINESVVEALGVTGDESEITIQTVNGPASRKVRHLPALVLSSRDGSVHLSIENAMATRNFAVNVKQVSSERITRWPHLNGLDVQLPDPSNVTILIGADQPAAHEVVEYRKHPLNPRAPRGILTLFGWCVIGPTSDTALARGTTIGSFHSSEEDDSEDVIMRSLRRFLGIESYGTDTKSKPPVPPEMQRALSILHSTTRHLGDRYESGLLWKSDLTNLPNNRSQALRRFFAQESRVLRDQTLAEKARKAMQESIELGHVVRLSQAEEANGVPGRTWYNSYHPVLNPNKPDKCRLVFNLAAEFDGASLNENLLKGPDLLTNLVGVLLRFRLHPVGLAADIVKMFHQVKVRKDDASALRFFWRPPGSSSAPAVYEWTVQPFGATSSPAVCCNALKQAARDSGANWETVYQQVDEHFYVDNWLSSFKSATEATKVGVQVIAALKRAGFPLAQFASSHPEVLDALGVSSREEGEINLDLDSEATERTLGLVWNPKRDTFLLRVTPKIPPQVKTKRELLQASSSLYDPLGFLAAVKLLPKRLFQEACRNKSGWDDPLDRHIAESWENWATNLSHLSTLEVPRCMQPTEYESGIVELHVFADASESAFGAVAYLRYVGTARVTCSFVMGKSHLAPMKPSTIPRNELNAALLAARLSNSIIDELQLDLSLVTLWSDSTTVLRWLNSATMKFTAYVGARVGEILELTSPSQWRYVPSADNPADEASRGIAPSELSSDHRWFVGPRFLQQDETEWPVWPDVRQPLDPDPEMSPVFTVQSTTKSTNCLDELIQRRSSPYKLFRIASYVLRAVNNLRATRLERKVGEIDATEVQNGRELLVRHVQELGFAGELSSLRKRLPLPKDSTLATLNPFLDARGLLCVGGRLTNAKIPPDWRYPIALPRTSRLTRLIIEEIHHFQEKEHLSVERTFQELRLLYWVTAGRATVKSVLSSCLWCKLRRAKLIQPKMANLPAARLDFGSPAFFKTGVDYFGPFNVTIFRRVVKRWICLFTCLTSRAVHLELAYSMSTDSFISCLMRFEARRGTPSEYFSDNGTNFVGAVNELAECLKGLDQAHIQGVLARRGVRWRFNPPSAPHFGGVWERLVRTAKNALHGVLSGRTVTDEILATAIVQVENLVNSRPLTYLSADPNDPQPLTPNHLIIGRANPALSPDIMFDADITPRKQWRHAQALATHFWHRWMREYMPTLSERKKWTQDDRDLRVGDIVALLDPANSRGSWKLARVQEIYLSPDGVPRSALVRVATVGEAPKFVVGCSEFHRPVTRMCLLLPADEKLVPENGHGAGVVPKKEQRAALPLEEQMSARGN